MNVFRTSSCSGHSYRQACRAGRAHLELWGVTISCPRPSWLHPKEVDGVGWPDPDPTGRRGTKAGTCCSLLKRGALHIASPCRCRGTKMHYRGRRHGVYFPLKMLKCSSEVKYSRSSFLSSRAFPHYPRNPGNGGERNDTKKDALNIRSLKLINAQKVVWRWKALLLSVINSGVTPLLIINNNNATEHATCKDLKVLLKYELLIYSDITNGKNETRRDIAC